MSRPNLEYLTLCGRNMEQMVQGILVVNTETIPGMVITETLGVVSGSTVRAKNVMRDLTQLGRNVVGGELVKYTELLEESRQEAVGRMVADAMSRGATAIVNVRFATSAVTSGAAELFAYGTAVKVE
ncbi:MAG: YbjQ family protein [Arenicellales bacterium]|nr:YbjQ family protein [Arenicellales bacterium]